MQNNRIGSYRVPKNTLCSHWCNSQNIWSIWRRTPCFTRSLSGIERFQPIFAVQSIAICCLRARHTIIYLARLNRLPDFVSRHALLQSSSVHKLYAYIKFDWSKQHTFANGVKCNQRTYRNPSHVRPRKVQLEEGHQTNWCSFAVEPFGSNL